MLVLRRVAAPGARIAGEVAPDGFPLVEDDGELGIDAGDFAVISDCRQAALFRVSRVERGDGVSTLVRTPGGESFDNAAGVSLSDTDTPYGNASSPEGAAVFGIVTEIYFIARGTGRNQRRVRPVLPVAKDDDGCAGGTDPGNRGPAGAPGSRREMATARRTTTRFPVTPSART